MKVAVTINENGTQLRLVGENAMESALLEFLDCDYSASITIERENDAPYYRAENRKAQAAVFTLLRNPDKSAVGGAL